MKYPHLSDLEPLHAAGMISARRHPHHPLTIYNYTVKSQITPISDWTEAMKDCRGLILDDDGEIVGRPFRKFWNLEQVQDQIPDGEPFTVWEKLDGSLGIACSYAGERIVATRGSFESEQAAWFRQWLDAKHPGFTPSGETWLFEIIFPENRIVVDYGNRKEGVLLAVMSPDGVYLPALFESSTRFRKARRFDGMTGFDTINADPQFAGAEGFVVQWANGFLAKVKLDEYKRLHRLITQCSTRTIWELIKSGAGIQELVDRVPEEFATWVREKATEIEQAKCMAEFHAYRLMEVNKDLYGTRKEFAMWAKEQRNPALLFSLLDGKDITEACWKLAEPQWATPFRRESDV
jgi:RNA ligase